MSHADYVAKCDEDQLQNLIEQASKRLADIKESGWVKLWTVNVGWANIAWFNEFDHAAAIDFACKAVKEAAAKRPGHGIEMEVSLEKDRPSEAVGLAAPKLGEQDGGKNGD